MSNEKDPISLLERAVKATESAKATPEEIAAWEAEKAAAVAAREKHAAHMDRAEKRSVEQMAIAERQAVALERIADTLTELVKASRAKQPIVLPPNGPAPHTVVSVAGHVKLDR